MQTLKNKPYSIICSIIRLALVVGVILAIIKTGFVVQKQLGYAATKSEDGVTPTLTLPATITFTPTLVTTPPPGPAYFASPNGAGSTCTLSAPCSLSTGTGKLIAGYTLYLRGGTYNVNYRVTVYASGTASSYITVSAYPGETAIIDGGNTVPHGLLNANGSYVEFKDLTIQNSHGNGVELYGSYDKLTNCLVTRSWISGVRAESDYAVIDGNRVYYNSLLSEYSSSGAYASGIQAENASYTMIKNNIVWNNWGEGINPYSSSYTTVQDNEVYDNLRVNLYIDNNYHGTFQRNLLYVTPGNVCSGYSLSDQSNIAYGDESDEPAHDNQYNKVINNIAVGGQHSFVWWNESAGSGLKDTIIANNTFVGNNNSSASIFINNGGMNNNSFFENNIIEQDGTAAIAIAPARMTGITWDYNNWNKSPVSSVRGAHDQRPHNPLLAKTGILTPGNLTSAFAIPQVGSPAIDKGINTGITTDFEGNIRPQGLGYDIGAFEFVP